MPKELLELVLIDLCGRLPYRVMIDYESHIYILNEIDPACKDIDYITIRIQDVKRLMCAKSVIIEDIKPYLRPMSSMTEEERLEIGKLLKNNKISPYGEVKANGVDNLLLATINGSKILIDWLNRKMFDYRGLIPMGLAIEAQEGMYKEE